MSILSSSSSYERIREYIKDLKDNSKSLVELKLGFETISEKDFIDLTNALKTNTTLQKLYLNDLDLTDRHIKYLTSILESNKTLQLLDVSNNHLSDRDVELLANSLASNFTLASINVQGNDRVTNFGSSVEVYDLVQTRQERRLKDEERKLEEKVKLDALYPTVPNLPPIIPQQQQEGGDQNQEENFRFDYGDDEPGANPNELENENNNSFNDNKEFKKDDDLSEDDEVRKNYESLDNLDDIFRPPENQQQKKDENESEDESEYNETNIPPQGEGKPTGSIPELMQRQRLRQEQEELEPYFPEGLFGNDDEEDE